MIQLALWDQKVLQIAKYSKQVLHLVLKHGQLLQKTSYDQNSEYTCNRINPFLFIFIANTLEKQIRQITTKNIVYIRTYLLLFALIFNYISMYYIMYIYGPYQNK